MEEDTRSITDGLRSPGFPHQDPYENIPTSRSDVLRHIGMEQMVQKGISQGLDRMVLAGVKLAHDLEKVSPNAAGFLYEALIKISEAKDDLESERTKVAIAQRDRDRTKAYGDYWRQHWPISRF